MSDTTLLIVDDERAILKQLNWALKSDFSIITARTVEEAESALRTYEPEIMILDLSLTDDPGGLEGFGVLESALKLDPTLKVVVMTGHDEKENALRAVEMGAYDFYAKPVQIDELRAILKRAAYLRSLEEEISSLRERHTAKHEFEGIIASSKPMLSVFDSIKRVSPTDVSVLISGESGTGKELVAQSIHRRSPRSDKPFVPINCGAIPENLLESELFGHEKGSFTGAHASKPGRFEMADGGTIFLDEIGELSPSLQVKLLRFLQDQSIERVGGGEPIQVDVRVIAATNRVLREMLDDGRFREDLFYRINTISIHLPPLRERGGDLMLLGMHFLHIYNRKYSKRIRGFSGAAQNAITRYLWPGNVRELENQVKRAVIMATGNVIQPTDMDLLEPERQTLKEARDEAERRIVSSTLLHERGNVSNAAKRLGITRPTLHDLMKKLEIEADDFRTPKGRA